MDDFWKKSKKCMYFKMYSFRTILHKDIWTIK